MSYAPSSERPGRNPRAEILREAEYLVNGSRNTQYGDPNQDFSRTAAMWSAYLGTEVHPHDVGWMMAMLKASRNRHQLKRDNYADAAGYIACAYDCATTNTALDVRKCGNKEGESE